jgi:hypothetical protein
MYTLNDIKSIDYESIRLKFIDKQDKKVIKNNSETIEDLFQNQILFLLEDYSDYSSENYDEIIEFVTKKIRTRLQPPQNKQVKTVEYNDNYENQLIDDDYSVDEEYFDKLKLLLIHYKPEK